MTVWLHGIAVRYVAGKKKAGGGIYLPILVGIAGGADYGQ